MPHRVFTDSAGRRWDVWTVIPSRVERRQHQDALAWQGPERRQQEEYRVLLGGQWTYGWLAFETSGEKRRLAPIPDGWEEMTPGELGELLARATLVRPSRRLVE